MQTDYRQLSVSVIVFSGSKAVEAQNGQAVCIDHFHRIHQALRCYMDDWGVVEPQVGVMAELSEIGIPPYRRFTYVLDVQPEWWHCPVWNPPAGITARTGYALQIYVGEPAAVSEVSVPSRELLRNSGPNLTVLLDANHREPMQEIYLNLAGTVYTRPM